MSIHPDPEPDRVECADLESIGQAASPPAPPARGGARRWLIAAGAAVTVAALVTSSIFVAERSSAESDFTDAQRRLSSTVDAGKAADVRLDVELESARKSVWGWSPGRLRDLPRVAAKPEADAVKQAVSALSDVLTDARATASSVTAPPKQEPARSPGALRAAAASATEERKAVAKQVGQIEDVSRTVVSAEAKLVDAVEAAAETLPKKTRELLRKYPKAAAKEKARFQSRMKAASTDSRPRLFALAVKELSALQRSHKAAAVKEDAAPATSNGPVPDGGPGQTTSIGGRSSAGQPARPATGPTSAGGQAGTTAPQGTYGGGSAPAATGGSSGSHGGSGGGSRPPSSGQGGGVAPKPNPPAPAPCRVTVIPQKVGAPSGPGTSGSQSGTVGGCQGPVTVTPGIPSNASATTSTSGASWTVHWSVPMPSDW